MTPTQHTNWRDFARRMARTCFNRHRRPSPQWIIEQVDSWFDCLDYGESWTEYTSWDQDDKPLCDHVTEFYDSEIPCGVCCKACDHECPRGYPQFDRHAECRFCDLHCQCYEKRDLAYEQFSDQWLGPVRCCIRAGLDLACEPSAGVLGFTVGDLRRMYPEGVPDWIDGFFEETLVGAPDGDGVWL